jgi:hypothetical protein
MKQILTFYLLLLSFPTSFGQNLNKSSLIVFDLEKAFSRQSEVPLSKFLNSINYVTLETNPHSIIGRFAHFEVTDEYIIVRDNSIPKQILLFDRKTGKFIKSIGKYGRGPNEYSRFSYIPYDPDKRVLYAVNSLRQLLVYNLSDSDVEIIKTPDLVGSGEIIQLKKQEMSFDIMMDDKIFVGYFINPLGMEKNVLALFTKDEVLKIFPNYQALKTMSHGVGGLMNDNHTIYKQDNKIYFLEVFSDTLFQLTRDSLIPRYYFKMGKFNVTWQINATMDHKLGMNYFYMLGIDESTKYLFINTLFKGTQYLGYVDKLNNTVTFCKLNSSGVSAFKDDISGLLDVRPVDITEKKEMVYIIKPLDLIKWFKENPEKAAAARKSCPWIKDIDEFSNPIIAIGSCKE